MTHTDLAFFSCSGISSDFGITSVEPKVVEVVREMIKNSSKAILLCDDSKVGKKALLKLTNFDDISYIIMNDIPKDDKLVEIISSKLITDINQIKEIK